MGGAPINYDAIGNPTSIDLDSLTWQGRELISFQYDDYISYSFEYNADGIRTVKIMSEPIVGYESRKEYMLDGSRIIGETMYETFDVSQGFTEQYTFIYLYDELGAPIGLKYRTPSYANGVFDCYFFEKNLQGDIVAIYNESGAKVGTYTYDAWGNCTVNPTSGYNFILSNNPFRYRGYYYDTETGFYYLQSRYYNPTWGRFINADNSDVITATPDQLTDKNLYAYCDNNPIMRVDGEGDFWHIVAGAAIGGLIGGISSIVGQAVSGQKINWAEVGVSAASGALTGAITAACPGMGAVATGIVHGVVGAGTHVATELVNGRTPTVAGTLAAGVTSGVLAGGTKAIGNAISSGKLEIGKIKGVRAPEGYPGVRYKTNAGPAYSVELHSSHNRHTPHLQVNKWLYQYKGYEGQPYRFRSWHYEFFKPWKGVY